MTFFNFSDYLKFQLNRDIQSEEFSKFIMNQKLMKIGKRSELNANIYFYFNNTTDVYLNEDNKISGDKIEFHSCDRNVIYYTIAESGRAGKQDLLLKAEIDKAMVADNFLFLIKDVSLIYAKELTAPTVTANERKLVEAYA